MQRFQILLVMLLWLPSAHAEPMPPIDPDSPLYVVKVEPGVSHEDVVDSLKSAAEGRNFVSPAVFPLGEHMRQRGLPLQGVLEVRSYCNLGLGAEIFLESPEFAVFAPCRIAIYQKEGQLYLALDRPSYALRYIKGHSAKAEQAVKQIEETLIWMMDKARRGEI
ncbi:hypothetical protein GALL_365990 [mine drainage metagenome]|uniref:DUF302 domain-containing protein n=1 Tax=mine drainage metagenome TaxID=410659 RepID=A0A1J5QNV9_9ZZZZ